jgi:hypothetical protein
MCFQSSYSSFQPYSPAYYNICLHEQYLPIRADKGNIRLGKILSTWILTWSPYLILPQAILFFSTMNPGSDDALNRKPATPDLQASSPWYFWNWTADAVSPAFPGQIQHLMTTQILFILCIYRRTVSPGLLCPRPRLTPPARPHPTYPPHHHSAQGLFTCFSVLFICFYTFFDKGNGSRLPSCHKMGLLHVLLQPAWIVLVENG